MNKKLLIVALTLAAVSQVNAWRFGRGCNTCATPVAASCGTACGTQGNLVIEEPTPPVCTKVVEVQPKKIVIPQPSKIERIAQPCKEVRIPQPAIPQPDIIKYEKVPDLIREVPQPALVRWECPCGTTASSSSCGC